MQELKGSKLKGSKVDLSTEVAPSIESTSEVLGPKPEIVAEGAGSLITGAVELRDETEAGGIEQEAVQDNGGATEEVAGEGRDTVETSPGFVTEEEQLRANKMGESFRNGVLRDPNIRKVVAQVFQKDPDLLKKLSTGEGDITPDGLKALEEFAGKMNAGVIPKPGSPVWGEVGARSHIGDVARSSARELQGVIERAFR
jgi:hypothetical protein